MQMRTIRTGQIVPNSNTTMDIEVPAICGPAAPGAGYFLSSHKLPEASLAAAITTAKTALLEGHIA